MKTSVKQLYNQFRPKDYILSLEPNETAKTFKGSVVIEGLKIGPTTQRLVFHQSDLKVTKAKITFHDKKASTEIPVSRINQQNKLQEVRLHTDEKLRSGRYTVELSFTGKITRSMSGIYPCFYEIDKKTKELLATQFESHHAREVFPCVDEPSAKATFNLTLTTPKKETVLSNTPIASESVIKDKKTTVFETTPKMSTYLLAFVTGDVKYKEARTKKGVAIRAYATPDKLEFVDFALDVAVKCLDFYSEYFGIDYPLEKCDLIALPDFAAGAMENWGLITFREQALLVDVQKTSLATKQHVALVVAHELAHQWFGNLVTMRWWTDLWLNEGFASWMEYFAIDHIFPEWQLWIQFAVDEQLQALALDALENTHPIEVAIKHPDEIRSIFDTISYSKGASVINMLHQFVGAENFKMGLRYYLEKHSYSNTDTIDLWKALEEVSKKPVKSFMHKWTTSSGFPIVKVDVSDKSISLAQERFFINPKHKTSDSTVWPIALFPSNSAVESNFNEKHATQKVVDQNLKINNGQMGFYRTAYNPTHLEKLGELIRRGKIKPIDRLGILSDVFETAKASKFDTAEALHFLSFFSNEDDFVVWDIIASSLGSLRMVMDDEDLRESMKPYMRELVALQLKRLGLKRLKGDSHFDRLLRPIIVSMAALADEPKVVKYCLDLFKSIDKGDSGVIDPDLKGCVFGTVARLGAKKEYEELLKLHNESTNSEERNTLVGALTSFKQPELIERSLKLITSADVRLQDVPFWIAFSFMNRYAKKQTWDWLKKNWDWLEKNLGTDLSFYRMPIYAARTFSKESFIKEYKDFFKPLITPAMTRTYKQGLEIMEFQSAWRDRSLKEVKTFFEQVDKA
jgi:aminopeptidase N